MFVFSMKLWKRTLKHLLELNDTLRITLSSIDLTALFTAHATHLHKPTKTQATNTTESKLNYYDRIKRKKLYSSQLHIDKICHVWMKL